MALSRLIVSLAAGQSYQHHVACQKPAGTMNEPGRRRIVCLRWTCYFSGLRWGSKQAART